ncbi:MAG TPA: YdeI/OmpD-associated family protein [Longimicrobium sp.]|nr:YdeI/OmpD-associated family protein [Longimicrobium sp.]
MGTRDPRIDAYIEKAAPFAQPILRHLRELVHATIPEVEEDLKWSMPSFMYKGMFCGFASFKEHAAFNFWKHSLIVGGDRPDDAMGSFGRITSLADLPPDDVIAGYLREAKRLNDEGIKVPKAAKPAGEKKGLDVPDDLVAALETNPAALEHFQGFSPSKRKDYIEWITEAKSDATRQKRLGTAVEWIAEGKARNWKYERK